jgi:hypothetical protein
VGNVTKARATAVEVARSCDDLSIRAELMLIANDLSDGIETHQSEKVQQHNPH